MLNVKNRIVQTLRPRLGDSQQAVDKFGSGETDGERLLLLSLCPQQHPRRVCQLHA